MAPVRLHGIALTAALLLVTTESAWTPVALAGDVNCPGGACVAGGDDIVNGTVDSADILDNAITSADILNGTIASVDILDNAITSADILNGTIASVDILDDTITSADILDNTITSADVGTNAVTVDELADNSVEGAAIIDNTITSADIGTDAVTADELADNAVDATAIQDGAVTTAKIAADAITSAKIAPGAVDTSDITDGAVTFAKLSPAVQSLFTASDQRFDKLEDHVENLDAGVAMALALSGVPLLLDKNVSIGVAAGFYEGQSAAAVKLGFSPTPGVVVAGGLSTDSRGNHGGAVGIAFGF